MQLEDFFCLFYICNCFLYTSTTQVSMKDVWGEASQTLNHYKSKVRIERLHI